ncbi:MAG: DUF935 domain-containing protein [Lachnospiraceae bacterium]|nr:DUF935 domain-containing protein [Lachnospiraceae bacterium]MCD8196138.1 DUF935 domain-containing protein [Lachnospiraceae bacterium]
MPNFKEIGRLGQKRYGGVFYEEFLTELRGHRGIAAYQEMADNDDIIGAMLYSIEMLTRHADWTVQPGGNTPEDEEAAEFVQSCMDDMQDTWSDTISEILSFLTYGWSAHEIVYKRRCGKKKDPRLRSKYTDGLIGWQKLPIRAQDTLYQWEYDDNDNVIGMTQNPPPDFGLITIPAEKLLLFRTKSRKGNPEGRSVLRNAYRDWYFKRRIQEIEGIGIERDLAGFPVLTAPEGLNIWDEDDPDMVAIRVNADKIVQNIRRDSMEGLTVPNGWTLQLLSTGGSRQFDTTAVIERYDSRIAMTVLADFILLGHQSVGSFALSSDKTKVFAMAVGAYLDIICEVFNNQAIPALIDINGDYFSKITDYPTLEHGDVEDASLDKVGDFINKTVNCGALLPDESLDDYLRQIAGMPERIDEWEAPEQAETSAANGGTDENGNQQGAAPEGLPSTPESRRRQDGETDEASDDESAEETEEEEDEDDMEKARRARKRLGRAGE